MCMQELFRVAAVLVPGYVVVRACDRWKGTAWVHFGSKLACTSGLGSMAGPAGVEADGRTGRWCQVTMMCGEFEDVGKELTRGVPVDTGAAGW